MGKHQRASARRAQRKRRMTPEPQPAPELISFECSVCWSEAEAIKPIEIFGDKLCQGCFDADSAEYGMRNQFEAHLRNEMQPVFWGDNIVPIDKVADQFPEKFLAEYRRKMKEYAVLPLNRIYCACGDFLGRKTKHPSSRRCGDCSTRSCSACGGSIKGVKEHACLIISEPRLCAGLTKGLDYQLCPSCATSTCLSDGYNHLICPRAYCKTHFCYICGEKALPGTGHWAEGESCPLYHRPGAEDPLFEPPPELLLEPEEEAELDPVEEVADMAIEMLENSFPNLANDLGLSELGRDRTPKEIERSDDRHALLDIIRALALGEIQQRPAWLHNVLELAQALIISLDIYTLLNERDHAARALERELILRLHEDVELNAVDIGFENFPRLRVIVDKYRAALEDEEADWARLQEAIEAANNVSDQEDASDRTLDDENQQDLLRPPPATEFLLNLAWDLAEKGDLTLAHDLGAADMDRMEHPMEAQRRFDRGVLLQVVQVAEEQLPDPYDPDWITSQVFGLAMGLILQLDIYTLELSGKDDEEKAAALAVYNSQYPYHEQLAERIREELLERLALGDIWRRFKQHLGLGQV